MANSDGDRGAENGASLRTVSKFDTSEQFDDFVTFLNGLCADGVLHEIAVAEPYSGATALDERWFVDAARRQWRLVAPDLPFQGLFEPV